jgi:hypothetical protein
MLYLYDPDLHPCPESTADNEPDKPIRWIASYLDPKDGPVPFDAIIGWLKGDPLDDDGTQQNCRVNPGDFLENEAFKTRMHRAIQECLEQGISPEMDLPRNLPFGGWQNVVDLAPCIRCAGADTPHVFGFVV